MALKGRMLFVDDSTKRLMDALKKYADRFDVTICANVPEALRYLSREEWDVVSLDFDLNGYDYQDPNDKNCGMEIVRYIYKCGWPNGKEKPNVIIHSSNIFGANLMFTHLSDLGFPSVRWDPYQYETPK
jgi:hypothetical protein